ncbi:MAG TPA: glycosyltransferase [Cyclobacteriaceae bacterium]|nr:glycosyltransferase [Cyclobacteriaceae bacterium]
MNFAICIPNYNYASYLSSTIESVLHQSEAGFEILVADNCSTDASIDVIEKYKALSGKIRYKVNPMNLGFAGNLDSVVQLVESPYTIMLSSDDLMRPNALSVYSKLIKSVANEGPLLVSSAKNIIDSEGALIRTERAADMIKPLWYDTDVDERLSTIVGHKVFKVESSEMLRRVIHSFGNPFNFLATCYSTHLLEKVGGYGTGRMINPDKWFHWRLLGEVKFVYFIDEPLFEYRWHSANQLAQEISSGYLKYLTDEYRSVIEIAPKLLAKAGISRTGVHKAFVNNVIIRHGLGELKRGYSLKALRVFFFGWATFPSLMLRDPRTYVYGLLVGLGPLGTLLLKLRR